MDDHTERKAHCIVLFAEAALADLSNIDNTTATMWGEAQAERYLGFLRETFTVLAAEPRIAAIIEERPDLLIFTAKFRKRRSAHGHRIIFREVDGGIEVIRILHTAMYWPDLLPEVSI
jgi:plasmid stabilization system protein ParE